MTILNTRISAIDSMRGFALLGILIINIQGFAMPSAAYTNPAAYGDLSGWNFVVWFMSYVFADSKFLALFSLLFGASLLLIQQQAATDTRLDNIWNYQLRRLLILFVIGMLHAYLIWPGDILVAYAICGVVLLMVHHWRPWELLLAGLLLLSLPSLHMVQVAQDMPYRDQIQQQQAQRQWQPPAKDYRAELNAYRGNWAGQQRQRVSEAVNMQSESLPGWLLWRAGGLMLIGMALFKLGILTGQKSVHFYRNMALSGLALGLPLVTWNAMTMSGTHWSFDYFVRWGYQINYWASLPMVAGYIGLVMWLCQTERANWLTRSLARVGKMALSNYLLQSLLCTFVFYGHGLGLFGRVDRTGQLLIVIAVWLLLLLFSKWWLTRFRYGPLEWLWRSSSRLAWQPWRNGSRA